MYNSLDSSQWHSTDEGKTDAGERAPSSGTVRIEPAGEPIQHDYVRVDPSARPINLAAFTGVGVVLLLGALFYLGIGNLRGDLIPQATEQTVILSATGFTPSTVTLPIGSAISLKNDTGQPQVLKSDTESAGPIAIPQILFDATPVLLTASASILPGTYVYYPETMSADTKLTIIVTSAADASTSSTSSVAAIIDDIASIPIPFDLPPASASQAASTQSLSPYTYAAAFDASSSSSSSIATIVAAAGDKNGSVVLDVGFKTDSSTSSQISSVSLPTNSLTVGNEKKDPVTVIKKNTSSTHNAATIRPLSNTASGPTQWLPIALTFIVFAIVSKRMLAGTRQ